MVGKYDTVYLTVKLQCISNPRLWKGEQLNIYQHTVSSWLTVTSSILALKWGVHGGSTTDCIGNPMVGDGKVKSMLGGGSWEKKTWRKICSRTKFCLEIV